MTTDVVAPPVMQSPAVIAARDGVSRQAVGRMVRDMATDHGLAVERDARGRIVAFNVAQYDHLRGRYADPSKDQRPGSDVPQTPPLREEDSYDEALRQKTWYSAERERIALAELTGEMVRTAAIAEAVATSAVEIAQIVDRLPNAADDLAAAVAKDGAHGLRVALKKLASAMRTEIADALDALATGQSNSAAGAEAAVTTG